MTGRRCVLCRLVTIVVLIALAATACGGADSDDADSEAASQAAGTLGNVDLSLVVNELETGFGTLGRGQRQAVLGIVEGGEDCTHASTERARPQPSQIEVEVVSIVAGCLVFSYNVANFRTLVADLNGLRDQADVIAVSPLLLDYRLNQIDSGWSIDAVDATAFVSQPTSPTGAGVTVAVIDSGIDAEHPGLEAASILRSPDSGTGDYTETGHGTVAASIMVAPIGASTRALAPSIELLDVPADLCAPTECGCDPCAPMTPAEAIRWSVDNGAHVISMSFGFVPAEKPAWWQLLLDGQELDSAVETIEIALAYARARDVAMVAAGGNCATGPSARCESEDQFEIPAGHPAVIGVAAAAASEAGAVAPAWYSTRQSYVELTAPGTVQLLGPEGDRFDKTGTSYATPFVAAALAVLIGTDGPLAERPDAATAARSVLAETASDLAPDGRDEQSGHGLLQIGAAIDAAIEHATENPLE